jgi:hypothetical protein
MTIRRILRYDRDAKLLRVLRVVWQRGQWGDKAPYSHKLTIGITPCLFRFKREWDGWILTLCGVRIHRKWSWGGAFA